VLADAENPVLGGGFVFWQQRANLNLLPWQVHARAIDQNGPAAGPTLHVSAAHSTHDCERPRVGMGASIVSPKGLCAYELRQGTQRGIAAVRLDSGQISYVRELSLSSQMHRLHDVVRAGTGNHWVVLYERGGKLEAKRLGRTGGTVATETIHAGTVNAACLGPHWGPPGLLPTPVLYVRSSAPAQLMLGTTTFSPDADILAYGQECGGTLTDTVVGSPREAWAGGELVLRCTGPADGTACLLWVALSSGSATMPGGCEFLLGANPQIAESFVFALSTAYAGHPLFIPLVDDPVFIGNLYLQVTWADPNLIGVTKATNALEARIR
jgi:hypothetical protein